MLANKSTYFDWWLPGDMRDQEVHGNVFTVHVLVYLVSDGLGKPVCVQVRVVLVNEGSSCTQNPTFNT